MPHASNSADREMDNMEATMTTPTPPRRFPDAMHERSRVEGPFCVRCGHSANPNQRGCISLGKGWWCKRCDMYNEPTKQQKGK